MQDSSTSVWTVVIISILVMLLAVGFFVFAARSSSQHEALYVQEAEAQMHAEEAHMQLQEHEAVIADYEAYIGELERTLHQLRAEKKNRR